MPSHSLFLCGIPASGKTSVGRHLSRNWGFAHYDLENYPRGWPCNLKFLWDTSTAGFVAALQAQHSKWVLDWGFPSQHVSVVRELRAAGARVIWFAANVEMARALFIKRGGASVGFFDRQVADIGSAGLPTGLGADIIQPLTQHGQVRDVDQLCREILGCA
jgi:hypothetical protein